MSAITWKSYYAVGSPELHRQHQRVAQIINTLYAAFRDGTNQAFLEAI